IGPSLGSMSAGFFPGACTLGCRLCRSLGPDPFEQHAGGLVVRVLRHKFAPECFGEDGLVQMVDQLAGAAAFHCEPVDPGKCCLDAANGLPLFEQSQLWNSKIKEFSLGKIEAA